MEAGLKELGAALLAGLVLVTIMDAVYRGATTGGWFNNGLALPGTAATGGLPPGSAAAPAASGSLPDPTTC
jgi:hypothetical protein